MFVFQLADQHRISYHIFYPQATAKAKTSLGVDMNREMIFIATIVPDDDGNLKIIRFEEFTDSKAYLDFVKGVADAKAKFAA